MSTSIRISSLNDLPVVSLEDFIPIVKSGSSDILTTYKTTVSSFNDFIAVSGSVISASWASSSLSSSYLNGPHTGSTFGTASWAKNAISASWAPAPISASWASSSISSSYLNGPHTGSTFGTASWSVSSSYAMDGLGARVVPGESYDISCSWASSSISASYLNGPHTGSTFGTASWAVSSSYAITSSYANTASYLNAGSSGPTGPYWIPEYAFYYRNNLASLTATVESVYMPSFGIPLGASSVILWYDVMLGSYNPTIKINDYYLVNGTLPVVGIEMHERIFPIDALGYLSISVSSLTYVALWVKAYFK